MNILPLHTPNTVYVLDILICTIEERSQVFNIHWANLFTEINKYQLANKINLIACIDNREASIGEKRNMLLDHSKAKYVMFLDDDDTLAKDTLMHIVNTLEKEDPDVIKLEGNYFLNGEFVKKFIHSIKFQDYCETSTEFQRPPLHINPIRASFAKKFRFPTLNHGEDTDWAMKLCKSRLLQKESSIPGPWYNYHKSTANGKQ